MPPLTFRPVLKRIRWGGRRLGTVLGKPIGEHGDYAESWEVVDHGNDQSVVDGGPYDGRTLAELVADHETELFGRELGGRKQFPLLIKFLDATDRLSVQVHPGDEMARRIDPAENGKTEAWVIMDAEPGAVLYAGLRDGVDESALRSALTEDRVADVLHTVEVARGDCLFIPAGTVHAIGEGVLLAEVQQSSDLTFRLSDWGRVGSDGRPRELHVEQSIEATNFARGPIDPQTPQPDGDAEYLCGCGYFVIRRRRGGADHTVRPGECHVLIGLEGDGRVTTSGGEYDCSKGRTVVVPAAQDAETVAAGGPDWTYLDVTIPAADPS